MEMFSALLAICAGNSPSRHKGQWRGALMFSLICVWINKWANSLKAGDLRRFRASYDVTVMCFPAALKILTSPERVGCRTNEDPFYGGIFISLGCKLINLMKIKKNMPWCYKALNPSYIYLSRSGDITCILCLNSLLIAALTHEILSWTSEHRDSCYISTGRTLPAYGAICTTQPYFLRC